MVLDPVGSLPDRQLRNRKRATKGLKKCSLPDRQLRKKRIKASVNSFCSLPDRQLRNLW